MTHSSRRSQTFFLCSFALPALCSHQEDSLWPLSDAKTLKDKFDDIFAATRYTKALESIFKLRKEKATEIKIMEADLKVMEASLEQAHKVSRHCTFESPPRFMLTHLRPFCLFAPARRRSGIDESLHQAEDRQECLVDR